MDDFLKNLDLSKIVAVVCPGAMVALWRSLALRGSFPSLSKDDLGSIILGAASYFLVVLIFGFNINENDLVNHHSKMGLVLVLLVVPSVIGFGLGLLESSDLIGKGIRRVGVRMPSPHQTAFETLFQEVRTWDLLVVYTTDDQIISGRWAPGSAASLDVEHADLYLSEYGEFNDDGVYTPHDDMRGIYIKMDDVKAIETLDQSGGRRTACRMMTTRRTYVGA